MGSVLLQHATPAFKRPQTSASQTSAPWEVLVKQLKSDFSIFGLDIVTPFCVDWYNQAVANTSAPKIPVPTSGAGGLTLAILVGNTKNMWNPFLEACNCSGGELLGVSDPVDTYVERTVEATCSQYVDGSAYRVYYGHKKSEELGGNFLPMQHVAHAVGLAYLDEDVHLALHPKYGPWFGLRGVLVFDGVSYSGPQAAPLKNPLCSVTRGFVRLALRSACNSSSDNLAYAGAPSKEQIVRRWRKWAAVREAPFPGHPWRYSNDQLEYHYTNDRRLLFKAAAAVKPDMD